MPPGRAKQPREMDPLKAELWRALRRAEETARAVSPPPRRPSSAPPSRSRTPRRVIASSSAEKKPPLPRSLSPRPSKKQKKKKKKVKQQAPPPVLLLPEEEVQEVEEIMHYEVRRHSESSWPSFLRLDPKEQSPEKDGCSSSSSVSSSCSTSASSKMARGEESAALPDMLPHVVVEAEERPIVVAPAIVVVPPVVAASPIDAPPTVAASPVVAASPMDMAAIDVMAGRPVVAAVPASSNDLVIDHEDVEEQRRPRTFAIARPSTPLVKEKKRLSMYGGGARSPLKDESRPAWRQSAPTSPRRVSMNYQELDRQHQQAAMRRRETTVMAIHFDQIHAHVLAEATALKIARERKGSTMIQKWARRWNAKIRVRRIIKKTAIALKSRPEAAKFCRVVIVVDRLYFVAWRQRVVTVRKANAFRKAKQMIILAFLIAAWREHALKWIKSRSLFKKFGMTGTRQVFNAWQDHVRKCKRARQFFQDNMLLGERKVFAAWRRSVALSKKAREICAFRFERTEKKILERWREYTQRSKRIRAWVRVHLKSLRHRIVLVWRRYAVNCRNARQFAHEHQRKECRHHLKAWRAFTRKCLKADAHFLTYMKKRRVLMFYAWRRTAMVQVESRWYLAARVNPRALKGAFAVWRSTREEERVATLLIQCCVRAFQARRALKELRRTDASLQNRSAIKVQRRARRWLRRLRHRHKRRLLQARRVEIDKLKLVHLGNRADCSRCGARKYNRYLTERCSSCGYFSKRKHDIIRQTIGLSDLKPEVKKMIQLPPKFHI